MLLTLRKEKRGRPRKIVYNIPTIINILTLIASMLIFPIVSLRLDNNFYVCDAPNYDNVANIPVLNLEEDCAIKHSILETLLTKNSHFKYMEILIKQNLAIDGHGYECISTYTNFFGARSSKRSVDIQKLSKLECEIMARSKTCNGFLMFCKNGNCEFDENPIENFKWLSTVLTTGYYCRLQKTKIRYKNKLFNETCNADNLECNLGDSILMLLAD
ncbi:hypothetical protein BpHYR1_017315 [Brachionus plicatilis]|uniref:Uncharacterized protein n=1 Tax=Brachionus plicatilis TaxID=10195 RepID=A0A3M7Q017_BRAPC|nr:hypothetical protein BpHYR1_017315 [Brachionus plicatilis]